MANLFKAANGKRPSEKDILLGKYTSARSVFLLVIVFTLINMIIAIIGQDTYFLFSIYTPYLITFLGALWCGKMPEIYYQGEDAVEPLENTTLMWVMFAAALIVVAIAFVLWLISKKPSTVKMTVILSLFVIDSVLMILLVGLNTAMVLDYIMHAYIIYSLAVGISAAARFNALGNTPEPIVTDSFNDVT